MALNKRERLSEFVALECFSLCLGGCLRLLLFSSVTIVHVAPHCRVGTGTVCQKLIVSSLLGEAPVHNHMDLVHIDDRAKPMCAVYHSLATHDVFQFTHDCLLCVRIEIACRLVKEEDLCLRLQETTSDQDALAFAT